MMRLALLLAIVPLATGLKPAICTRRGVLVAASSFACAPAYAETEVFETAKDAADLVKEEGVLKSTGKQVPAGLTGFVVLGSAAAAASFVFGGPGEYERGEKPLPTGIATYDPEKYEESRWTNAVDLPWMAKDSDEPEAQDAGADSTDGTSS